MEITRTSVILLSALVIGLGATSGVAVSMQASDGMDSQQGNMDNGQAISFIAFCSVDGVSQEDVTIESVMEDEDGEVESVTYSVSGDVNLNTITYKAGTPTFELTDPPNSGTVATGDGSSSSITPSNFCPGGQSGVKYENYNSNTGMFENIEES